jgi:RimJ/RimL family protein N-acetyltransferase
VIVGNEGSCGVLERIGMGHDGVMRQMTFLRGEHVDMHLYAIVRADWESESAYRTRFDFLEAQ